jgi:hypothetical protein
VFPTEVAAAAAPAEAAAPEGGAALADEPARVEVVIPVIDPVMVDASERADETAEDPPEAGAEELEKTRLPAVSR